jgi:hypothetical protein
VNVNAPWQRKHSPANESGTKLTSRSGGEPLDIEPSLDEPMRALLLMPMLLLTMALDARVMPRPLPLGSPLPPPPPPPFPPAEFDACAAAAAARWLICAAARIPTRVSTVATVGFWKTTAV